MNSTSSVPVFYSTLDEAPLGHVFIDAFVHQVKELFRIEHTEFLGRPKSEAFASEEFKTYAASKAGEHTFVYFPWLNTLVKTVLAEDYFSLITNRNQDLITKEEQLKLRDFNVAILGLSVGSPTHVRGESFHARNHAF